VPIERIAAAMGLEVRLVPGLKYSGMVESTESSALISVRSGEVPWRQRFTIAHEIGHLMLHPLGERFRDTDSFSGDERERQANTYGASLLMPLWMVEPFAMTFGADAGRIAAVFGVSREAMNITLGKLVGR
jgi:Zn-dependent peptidase ImmA (M78 family)